MKEVTYFIGNIWGRFTVKISVAVARKVDSATGIVFSMSKLTNPGAVSE